MKSLLKSVLSRLVSAKTGIGGEAVIVMSYDGDRIIFPVTPEELPPVQYPQNNDTFSAINYDLAVGGGLGLRSFSLNVLVPVDPFKYAFANKFGSTAEEIIKFLDTVQQERRPARVTIVYSNGSVYLNMTCLINNFVPYADSVGDYHLSMDCIEWRTVDQNGGVYS